MATIKNIYANPVEGRTKIPRQVGVATTAGAVSTAADGIGKMAANTGAITDAASDAAKSVAGMLAEWQRQRDEGMGAGIKVSVDSITKDYLIKVNSKGISAVFDNESDGWKKYNEELDSLLDNKNTKGMSDSYRQKLRRDIELIKQNTMYQHTLHGITEERRVNVENGKALIEMTVNNVSGALDKVEYMKAQAKEINKQMAIIYHGQDINVIQNESGKVYTAMYINAVESAIAQGNYDEALEMIGYEGGKLIEIEKGKYNKIKIPDNENIFIKFNETLRGNTLDKKEESTPVQMGKNAPEGLAKWDDEQEGGATDGGESGGEEGNKVELVSEDYILLSTPTRKKLLDIINKAMDDKTYAGEVQGYSTRLMPGSDVQGGAVDELLLDIESRVNSGELTRNMGDRLREGLNASINNYLDGVQKQTSHKQEEIRKEFAEMIFQKTFSAATVRNHPEASKLLTSREYEYYMSLGQKIEYEKSGNPVLSEDHPDVRAWRERMLYAVDKGYITSVNQISRFNTDEEGYNKIPLSVIRDVEQRLEKHKSGMPNYLEIGVLKYAYMLTADEQELVKKYGTLYMDKRKIDPYDESNQEEIYGYIKEVVKTGVRKKGEEYTNSRAKTENIKREEAEKGYMLELHNGSVPLLETFVSTIFAKQAILKGKNIDKVIDEYARQQGWSAPYYKGGLTTRQDEHKLAYNTIGRSYGIDPNLLAVYDMLAAEYNRDNPEWNGAMIWSDNFEVYLDGHKLGTENYQDNIESLAIILSGLKQEYPELSIKDSTKKIIEQLFGDKGEKYYRRMHALLTAKYHTGSFYTGYEDYPGSVDFDRQRY